MAPAAAASKRRVFRTFHASKDPAVFVVVGEDSAARLGILVAFAGVFLSHRLHNPLIDGGTSIVTGLILGAVALLLVYASHALVVGESAHPELVRDVRAIDWIEATVRERHSSVERIFLEVEAIRASGGGERRGRAEPERRPAARRS